MPGPICPSVALWQGLVATKSCEVRVKRGSKSLSAVGNVRIIAGEWRGRRLPVADVPGLRPTADRARETVFNWLQPYIGGARCLDLFAGSGALGLEAASRGAGYVCLIEKELKAYKQLQANIETLKASDKVGVVKGDALTCLRSNANETWDIVFVDPPWQMVCQEQVLELLLKHYSLPPVDHKLNNKTSGVLNTHGMVYMESPIEQSIVIPSNLTVCKEKTIGMARMQLLKLDNE